MVTRLLQSDGKPAKRTEKEPAARPGLLGVLIAVVKFSLPLLKPVLTAYAGKRFVRVRATPKEVEVANVAGTNCIDFSAAVAE